jgi:hypothetical protein
LLDTNIPVPRGQVPKYLFNRGAEPALENLDGPNWTTEPEDARGSVREGRVSLLDQGATEILSRDQHQFSSLDHSRSSLGLTHLPDGLPVTDIMRSPL